MKEFIVTTTSTILRTYNFYAEDESKARNYVNNDYLRLSNKTETKETIISLKEIIQYRTGTWFTLNCGFNRMIIEDSNKYYNTISDDGKIQLSVWQKSIPDLLKLYPDIVEK